MIGEFTSVFPPELNAEGQLRLEVEANSDLIAEFASSVVDIDLGLPRITLDFKTGFEASLARGDDGFEKEVNVGSLVFDNIKVDVGDTLSTIVKPILNVAGNVLGPISNLTGLGMDQGLQYGGLEVVEIVLGQANDQFAVLDTAPGSNTAIHATGGNDEVNISSNSGRLIVFDDISASGANGSGTAYRVDTFGDDTLDSQATFGVVLYGGPGTDELIGGGGADIVLGGSERFPRKGDIDLIPFVFEFDHLLGDHGHGHGQHHDQHHGGHHNHHHGSDGGSDGGSD